MAAPETLPASAPATATPATTPPPRGGKRWLAVTALALLLLVLVLSGLLAGAVYTEPGARALWRIASAVAPGKLTGIVKAGTLAHGLDLRDVVYQDNQRLIRIDRLDALWQADLSARSLVITKLKVGTADLTLQPSAPKPLTLPADIRLPLALRLEPASIGEVVLHDAAGAAHYRDIRLAASSDRVHHHLTLTHADTPFGVVKASVDLAGTAPFAISGTASVASLFQQQQYTIDATVGGSLQALALRVAAAGGTLHGSADIDATPFAAIPFTNARIVVTHLDPKLYNAAAPHADLDIRADVKPAAPPPLKDGVPDLKNLVVRGPVTITNTLPGALDKGLLPLVSASADVVLDATHQQLANLALRLAGGATVAGSGEMRGADGGFHLTVAGLDLHALQTTLKPTALNGPIDLTLAGGAQTIVAKLASKTLSISADAVIDAKAVNLRAATLAAGASQVTLSGTLGRDPTAAFAVKGALKDFDPDAVLQQVQGTGTASAPVHARINMDFDASGALQPELAARMKFGIHDSTYNKLPMQGGGTVQILGKRLVSSDASVSIAGNDVAIKGGFGAPADRLDFRIDAPALERLGFGLAGLLQASGKLAGTLTHPVVDATYKARGVVFGAHRLAQLSGQAHIDGVPGQNPNARVAVTVAAQGIKSGVIDLDQLDARIDGTYARHSIDLKSTGTVNGQPVALTLAAQGAVKALGNGYAWNGVVDKLENRGYPKVAIGSPLTVAAAPGQVTLGSTTLTLGPAQIDLKGLEYGPGLIRSAGAFSALQVAELLELRRKLTGAPPPLKTTLALDGSWNFSLGQTATGFVQVARRSGDVTVTTPYGASTIGLDALRLRADLQGTRIALSANAGASRIGKLDARGTIGLVRENGVLSIGAASPLALTVAGAMPKLASLAVLTGPQIALDGAVALNVTAAGTVGAPKLSGTVKGDRLGLTLFDQGVKLKDGIARITLDNNFVDLREVVFHGGTGTLKASGRIPLEPTGRELSATITADHLQLLTDPSRQLTISGQARIANVNQQLQVNGRFKVDRALFTLPDKAAPELSDDVVIVHPGAVPKKAVAKLPATGAPPVPVAPGTTGMASLLPPLVNINVDLGDSFRFKGAGADIFLGGALDIKSGPKQQPQAFGTVRVVSGVYEAFGAKLAIESGLFYFQGAISNPSINLLAMRRNQAVAAGVQVTGTVQQPRVELVSEPNLSEEEKLSWLVFGHGGSGGSAGPGAAQSAAFGLLNKFGGTSIASKVGLDKFSVGSSEFGKSGAQVVNLGKEISNKLFIGFEQGLSGASSAVKLTYELSQHWSLVVRGGAVTGVDVLYSRRFDKLRGESAPRAVP